MSEQKIEDVIRNVLTGTTQKNALDFVSFLRTNEIPLMEAENYWEVKYKDECVCYILITGADELPGPWTIWSDQVPGTWIAWDDGNGRAEHENSHTYEQTKEVAWKHANFCASCGSDCSPGKTKTILGKEFSNLCGSALAFTNPDEEALECAKKMVIARKNDILMSKMESASTYPVLIGGRTLELPIVPLANAPISIALFDCLGDIALCDFLAEEMLGAARARQIDLERIEVILTAGKAVTLAESMARMLGLAELSIAEKHAKNFWSESFAAPSRSITGGKQEELVVGGRRAELLKGKRILVVDDVISTGESIRALVKIARHFGEASLIMAPFAEGDHDDMTMVEGVPAVVLGRLPTWPR